ncbi:MAG: DUF2770 domain-containing protein [SAR86 cluster bacterium]|uniref:DUF2770 domain-containing protein n=1 Tax=SAR86 cluster bacterium TaxID=2030880 RepID=A0A520MS10_9GAMM|nr:MAG: DUF2770 domain-containing protein [SAR86 cluster bacterium]
MRNAYNNLHFRSFVLLIHNFQQHFQLLLVLWLLLSMP